MTIAADDTRRTMTDWPDSEAEPLSEPAIRALVRSRLPRLMASSTEALIVEEMEVCSGRARIDFAVIADQLIGIEIKGPKDSVSRLPRQAEAYSRCFDLVVLVVHESLARRAEELVPSWWGIVSGRVDGSRTRYRFNRLPEKNPSQDLEQLLALLWREELNALLAQYCDCIAMPKESKRTVRMRIVANVDADELRKAILLKLKERTEWRAVTL